ncbi:MAG: copper resistance protein CopC [Ectothiorhodospiraceae bacterium]
MMLKSAHWPVLVVLLGLFAAPAALAHGEAVSEPEDGATVASSPETIHLEFGEPARVTQFQVQGPEGPVALDSEPSREASRRVAATPEEELASGDYTVSWRALSEDGHAISGDFAFTVE